MTQKRVFLINKCKKYSNEQGENFVYIMKLCLVFIFLRIFIPRRLTKVTFKLISTTMSLYIFTSLTENQCISAEGNKKIVNT